MSAGTPNLRRPDDRRWRRATPPPVGPRGVTPRLSRRYPSVVDESELVAAARSDPDAFARLYERTAPLVYRFAYSLVHDHPRAEDVVAETYRRAIDRLPVYRDQGRPFHAWLFTIARNLAIDGGRRSRRETPLLDHDVPVDGWLGEALVHAEERSELQAALGMLGDDQRTVLVLRYGHEWTCRQVAAEMGRSEAAVKQLSYRAVNRLRELLKENGYVRNP
ncbi:MAG: RNA polymerase subunit sigma-70 [Anaerolinea sp.]|nr:RNA polymerase subunit sigma-70 [Anaerolinea sp.]